MPSGRTQPAYLSLTRDDLHDRASRAIASLANCRACPRDCCVNRLDDKWAAWILQISDKEREIVRDPDLLPDPENNANDCEALIRWLQERGYDIEIWWSGTAYTHRSNVNCRVKMKYRSDWERPKEGTAYDDWKQGVCELALKVIE